MHPFILVPPVNARLNPITHPDAVFDLLESYIIAAERQIRGREQGSDRLDAVTVAASQALDLPEEGRAMVVQMMVQMVYTSIARTLPASLRHSTMPPAPDRERTP